MQFTRLACFAVLGLTGCGASPDESASSDTRNSEPPADPGGSAPPVIGGPAGSSDPAAVALANVDLNLERLRALRVVEVRGLIAERPTQTGNCYGNPCPGSLATPADLRAKAALRLASLADVAERAVTNEYVNSACIDRVDVNLGALRALEIVELGEFIRQSPVNNPLCYHLPCPADVAVASAENEARAADLESIALAAAAL